VRPEITDLIRGGSKVLDVGCGLGDLGNALTLKGCDYLGIEKDKDKVRYMLDRKYMKVILGDLRTVTLQEKFDYIIFADVLEHLERPKEILSMYAGYLNKGGKIIISIPNIAHISIILSLLKREWKYTDYGILDKTHLKFFTLKSFLRLLNDVNLTTTDVKRIFSLKGSNLFNKLTLGIFKEYLTCQYVFVTERR